MAVSGIRQQILEHIESLLPQEVKVLLSHWLVNSEGDLEDFEPLLTNQLNQIAEEAFEFGEIDTALNFQPLTETQMVEKSLSSLEAYRSKGSGVPHERVREWIES
ncbi:MAG: hypothetical protein KME29_25970 [Calothrix sp. FI2-JRJ7]|jgi:hypothetical protein|nr:hypothetical protein [Calothrix sp. FI2-JRJ7]